MFITRYPSRIMTDCLVAEPRYTSLPNIMKAKKKPIEKVTAEELGVDLQPRLQTIKVTEPPKRQGGAKVRRFSTSRFFVLTVG